MSIKFQIDEQQIWFSLNRDLSKIMQEQLELLVYFKLKNTIRTELNSHLFIIEKELNQRIADE